MKFPDRAAPRRRLRPEELTALEADGAICARGLLDKATVDHMRDALEDVLAQSGVIGGPLSMPDDGFHGDVFVWKLHDAFRDLALFSCLPELANQILRSTSVQFFYEQFFVKRAGSPIDTPWHQDLPFWPVAGTQVASFWITLDPVSRASSGLEFVRGSHKWEKRYKAVTPNHDPYMADTDLEAAPDFSQLRREHELLGWDMEPGDVLVFGPLVAHGSGGNASQDRDRRALAFRYCGDDVTFAPRHATMPLLWDHGLEPGDRLGGPLFPQVLPEVLESEVATRWAGPEAPSDRAVAAFLAHLEETGFGAGFEKKPLLDSERSE
ncbi:MAG: phytanoyl-CoA dioxygenase family protein [Candidatus Binatia bacterium]|nr:phytanoyl-CoA dioxygenase family protein [Candidatus Binatia bacterium]